MDGRPIEKVREILGHSTVQVPERYAHLKAASSGRRTTPRWPPTWRLEVDRPQITGSLTIRRLRRGERRPGTLPNSKMSVDGMKTVWVLGSGFSKSLGGPLLGDLFRPNAWGDDLAAFSADKYPDLAGDLFATREIFNAGQKEGRWGNAEDFLAYLDAAEYGKGGSKWTQLQQFMNRWYQSGASGFPLAPEVGPARRRLMNQPSHIARRALAAECTLFLRDFPASDERWEPYDRWVESLSPERDTVITFNYDLVPEECDARREKHTKERRFVIPLPTECHTLPTAKVPVFKLHGSVDWILRDGACQRIEGGEVRRDADAQLAIAAPGLSKATSVARHFQQLWVKAKSSLTHAGAIVFVGYSMPQTDALARLEIQDAIRADDPGEPHRRIDVVMGPNTRADSVRRLIALLETCRAGRTLVVAPDRMPESARPDETYLYVKVHPLGAEDFIPDYPKRVVGWKPAVKTGATVTHFP